MEYRVTAHSGCSFSNVPLEFFIGKDHHVVSRVISSRLEESPGAEPNPRQVWMVEDRAGVNYRLTYFSVTDRWDIAGG